jgi:hypothetical protein
MIWRAEGVTQADGSEQSVAWGLSTSRLWLATACRPCVEHGLYCQRFEKVWSSFAPCLFMHPFGPCLDVADDDVYCLVGSHLARDVSAAHEGAHILQGVYRSDANSLKKVTA